jgi:hypothetical protein
MMEKKTNQVFAPASRTTVARAIVLSVSIILLIAALSLLLMVGDKTNDYYNLMGLFIIFFLLVFPVFIICGIVLIVLKLKKAGINWFCVVSPFVALFSYSFAPLGSFGPAVFFLLVSALDFIFLYLGWRKENLPQSNEIK